MNIELLFAAAIVSATPILFAALGQLLTERAGVLNLGIEGTMLVGAVCGFVMTFALGSTAMGLVGAAICGGLFSAAFAFCVVTLRLDQVVTGLAFSILGSGLSAFVGQAYVGKALPMRGPADAPSTIAGIPGLGVIIFNQDAMVFLAFAIAGLITFYLYKTRPGLILRTLGESPETLDSLGITVVGLRYAYIIAGGALIALGGAYLSVINTPTWVENMTAGRGWIALAIVIFASWRPGWVVFGALLFGLVDAYRFRAQASGQAFIDPHFLNMLPYLTTLIVLIVMSRPGLRARLRAPAALGIPYDREKR
ncbi:MULTISPECIES: ABC transporter permease [unclassified Chelatococcus]|uniref:ABC transporter permease n=1 Tax=unclassified Chelatococcus TaxID=2638111 RepID=UPI001BCF0DFA|nr:MULTISPECIES: ABC transporter permease [unclassified Chelatococcus]MBS7699701.1 ABC transporter permease [Chelatococcus sp. YT9]MBX3557101.1 ABC transporter permease [Chelatococcus sp.]